MNRLLWFAAFALATSLVKAQPGPSWMPSLEWLVADSSLIVRGHITSAPPLGGMYGGNKVVLQIDETLKGEGGKEQTFAAFFGGAPVSPAQRWAANGKELLVFLNETKSFGVGYVAIHEQPFPYALHGGQAELAMFELDAAADIHPVSMSGEQVTDPNDILRRVKDALKFVEPKPLSSWNMPVRSEKNLPHYDHTGMGSILTVPVDSRLEKLARDWVKSSDGSVREDGTRGLAFFKNPENIATMKKLLDDPFTSSYVLEDESKRKLVKEVREAAKDALDAWDIPWDQVHQASIAASREMIRIPAGEFTVGGTEGADEAGPARKVTLPEYWIGKTDVTVSQYRVFCKATGYPYNWDANKPSHGYHDDHPMVSVTWPDAVAFCHWVGGELPTENQWEKAARGTDGRRFPWGNTWDVSRLQGWENSFSGWRTTAPVGSFPTGASPYGCLDMVGNAWQWCAGGDPKQRPCRGGGYDTEGRDLRFTQVAGRGYMNGDSRIDTTGFRVAGSKRLKLP